MLTTLMADAVATGAAAAGTRTIDLPVAGDPSQRVSLHCIAPAVPSDRGVLFIHGASFPTALAAGFAFAPGDSWLGYVAGKGFHACGLDFRGFGASTRPPGMQAPAGAGAPVERAPEAADDIAAAVDYLHAQGISRVHLVAHSWGTIPTATFAARHGASLASLTLFGPVVPVPSGQEDDVAAGRGSR